MENIMKKRLGLLLVAAGLLSSTTLYAQDKLVVGTNPAYPPFEYKGENNELLGFDIDLMNEVCNVLEKECVYSEQEFDALIPNLRLRRYDAVISGMDITEERAKQLAFSDPYYQNYSIYITTKDKADQIKDVANTSLIPEKEEISQLRVEQTDLATGNVRIRMDVDDKYYYENMSCHSYAYLHFV